MSLLLLLLVTSLGGIYSFLGLPAFLLLVGYYSLSIIYSVILKATPPADIIVVAIFFLLRPIMGAVAINVPVSSWMIITTFFAALYLVVLKRSSELQNIQESQTVTRRNINHYSRSILIKLGLVSLTAAMVSYAIYASGFPDFFALTIVPLVGLCFRVVMLHERQPTRFEAPWLIFSDRITLIFGILWLALVLIYHW